MTPCNAVIPQSKDELADLVWLRTGKTPATIRCQALHVVAEYADGTISVHRIEDLVR